MCKKIVIYCVRPVPAHQERWLAFMLEIYQRVRQSVFQTNDNYKWIANLLCLYTQNSNDSTQTADLEQDEYKNETV